MEAKVESSPLRDGIVYTWLLTDETPIGEPIAVSVDSVQAYGLFGGCNVFFEASNADEMDPWWTLRDNSGIELDFTEANGSGVSCRFRFARPRASGGKGVQVVVHAISGA